MFMHTNHTSTYCISYVGTSDGECILAVDIELSKEQKGVVGLRVTGSLSSHQQLARRLLCSWLPPLLRALVAYDKIVLSHAMS
jgi:hypothetical protein